VLLDRVEQSRHSHVIRDHRRDGAAVGGEAGAVAQCGKQRVFLAGVVIVVRKEAEEADERLAVLDRALLRRGAGEGEQRAGCLLDDLVFGLKFVDESHGFPVGRAILAPEFTSAGAVRSGSRTLKPAGSIPAHCDPKRAPGVADRVPGRGRSGLARQVDHWCAGHRSDHPEVCVSVVRRDWLLRLDMPAGRCYLWSRILGRVV
jgi:hypothetical protein